MIVGSRAIAGSMFYKLSACPHRATAAPFTNLADRVEINPQERVTCSTDKDGGAAVMLPNPSAAQDFERMPNGAV